MEPPHLDPLSEFLSGISTGIPLLSLLKILTSTTSRPTTTRQLRLLRYTALSWSLAQLFIQTFDRARSTNALVMTLQAFLFGHSIQCLRILLLLVTFVRAQGIVGWLGRWRWWVGGVVVLVEGVPGFIGAAMMTAEFNCYAQYPTPTATCMTLLTAPSLRSMSHNVAAVADFAFSIQVLFLDILFISSLYRRLSHIASSHHREILFGSRTLLQFILYVCILGSIVWNLVVKIMKVDFWQPGGQAWRFVESFIFITVAEFGMDVRKIIERCRREMIPRSGTGSSSLGSVDSAGSDGARRSGSMSYVGGGSQNSMQSTQIGSHSGVALVGGSGDKSARRWSGSGVEALRMVMRESALRDGVRMV